MGKTAGIYHTMADSRTELPNIKDLDIVSILFNATKTTIAQAKRQARRKGTNNRGDKTDISVLTLKYIQNLKVREKNN